MEWVETTGATVEAARDAALDELGVDERDAELVVVAEPRSGLFGFGRVEARVRARVRPAPPRPKRAQRRRGDDRGRGRSGGRKNEAGEKTTEAGETAAPSRTRRSRGRRAAASGSDGRPDDGAEEAVESSAPSPRRRRGSGAPRATGAAARAGNGDETGQRPEAGSEEAGMTIEEQAEAVERFVSGVVDRFGFDDATTAVRVQDDHVLVDVTGEELGLLIGPRGRTLDALQELARTVVQRRGEEGGTRVVVDVAGFRAKRAAALEAFTRRVAAEVLAQDAPQALEAMSSADRKIVHDTATTIDGVHTSSEGVDPHRYVVIHPGASSAAESDTVDA